MNKLIVLGGYLMNPLIGIILTIRSMKNRKLFIFGLSLLTAFYSFNINPIITEDLFRHYKYFDDIVEINNFNPFGTKYFGMYILCYVIKFLGLNKRMLVFISTFISSYFLLQLVVESSKKIVRNRDFLLNVIFFLVIGIDLITFASGIRWGISSTFFLYGIKKYFDKKINRVQVIPYFFIAICMHRNVIILIFIFILSEIIKAPFKNTTSLKIMISILLLYWMLFFLDLSAIKNKIMPNFNRGSNKYLKNGKWGTGYYTIMVSKINVLGKIELIVRRFIDTIFPIIYMLGIKNLEAKYIKKEYNFMFILFYINLFLFKYFTLFGRLKYTLMILICLNIIRNYTYKSKPIMEIAIIFVIILKIIFNFKEASYFLTPILKMVYSIPLFKILNLM